MCSASQNFSTSFFPFHKLKVCDFVIHNVFLRSIHDRFLFWMCEKIVYPSMGKKGFRPEQDEKAHKPLVWNHHYCIPSYEFLNAGNASGLPSCAADASLQPTGSGVILFSLLAPVSTISGSGGRSCRPTVSIYAFFI